MLRIGGGVRPADPFTWEATIRMQIRVATVRDLAAVISCTDLAFAPHEARADENVIKHDGELTAQLRDGAIHLICDGPQVLGYISLCPIAQHLYIDRIAVLPKLQGRGLGGQLLAFAEREASRLGLSSLRLFTKAAMASNLLFYRRRGYHETGRCDDDGFCRVFYSKDVATPAM